MITSNKTLSVFHPTYHLHPHKKLYVLTIFQVLIGSNVCHHLVLRDKVVILPIFLITPGTPTRIIINFGDNYGHHCDYNHGDDDHHQSPHHLVVCGIG